MMFRPVKTFVSSVRYYYNRSAPRSWEKDGVKYGFITYYPRFPNEKDPPITPTKLLLVERVKPVKGNPYWEKEALKRLGIDSTKKGFQETVVKNTPEMCHLLWGIKHLIRVRPVELPENLPDDIDSISTYLHENGKLLVFPKIDETRYKAAEEFKNNPKKLDMETIKEKLRLKWLNAME